MKPRNEIQDKGSAIARGCLDDWPETEGITPFDCACICLALLTSPVKTEREEAKLLVRRWRMLGTR